MEESTTGNLAKILSNIDSAREMEEYLELPEVVNSWQSFPEYFQSLEAVREMDSRNLIRSSGLERSYYYQVMKGEGDDPCAGAERQCRALSPQPARYHSHRRCQPDGGRR